MSDLIDTSILVAAIIGTEQWHRECQTLVAGGKCGMYSHGIAETFSTLTGGKRAFRLDANTASQFLEEHFIPRLTITSLTPAEMLRAMREAQRRGVRGGGVFDYLHLVAARKAKASRIYTLNLSNFRALHRPGDPEIVHPGI